MAFSKLWLFLIILAFTIFLLSLTNDYHKLTSTVSSLQSIIKEKQQELLTKEEKIHGLELFIREKSYLFENDIGLSQSEYPVMVKHTSEADEKVYGLQKQIFELRRALNTQHKRMLELETRVESADKEVSEPNSKVEDINGKWFVSKLGLNTNKTQKWIPSMKDTCVTLFGYVKPKVQYIKDKSIEVLYTSKQALTPYLIQGFNVIVTIAKPHLEKVKKWLQQVVSST